MKTGTKRQTQCGALLVACSCALVTGVVMASDQKSSNDSVVHPLVTLASNDRVATSGDPDCNGNGIPDATDIADGTSTDCNSNGVPDECDIDNGTSQDCDADGMPDDCGQRFPLALSENTTGFPDWAYLQGPPGHDYDVGIGGQIVTYDFGTTLIIDGAGVDFNVYEVDNGSAEFGSTNVLVSDDGVNFISVKSSETSLVRIPGDEALCCNGYGRSYDVSVTGFASVRYVRIDGNGDGASGPNTGFDLSLVGSIHSSKEVLACCGADVDGSGTVDVSDLLQLLADWGTCNTCPSDIDANGAVDVNDLLRLLSAWGCSG